VQHGPERLARIDAHLADLRARVVPGDPSWKYVEVRRRLLTIEQAIEQSLQWVVFEPDDDATWLRVVRTVTDYLLGVWQEGWLVGSKVSEAFFVRCDRTTMTQDDIDNGRLICLIGIAPVKPAEFVIFRIQQKTLDAKGPDNVR
jgi:phage tail sheath protein FI